MGPIAATFFVALSSVALNPSDQLVSDQVDLIEINHHYDKGRHVLDQIIFYEWSDRSGRYEVRDWRMLKKRAQVPRKDWSANRYVAVWYDTDSNNRTLRRVTSKALRETWTKYDPELYEREFRQVEERRKLSKITFTMTK